MKSAEDGSANPHKLRFAIFFTISKYNLEGRNQYLHAVGN